MYLRRTFSIYLSKFNLVFKLLFYIAIVIIIMAAIGVSILMPTYRNIVSELQDTDIIQNSKDSLKLLIQGDFEEYAESFNILEDSYYHAKDLLIDNLNKLYKLYVMVIIIAIISKILITLSYIPFVDTVNKFMHSNIDGNVTQNFIEKAKKSLVYSVFDILILVPIDIGLMFLIFAVVSLLSSILGIFTMSFAVAFALGLYSLRVNLFAGWMPAIVYDNMKVCKALGHSFKTAKTRLSRTYLTYFIVALFSMAFYIIFGMATLGLGYILGLPMIILFYRVLDLVTYYNINDHRYYLDNDTIAEPRL